jgi:hypothetical protein
MISIAAGQRFGAWEIVEVKDRQAFCRCCCSAVRLISVDAIVAGTAARRAAARHYQRSSAKHAFARTFRTPTQMAKKGKRIRSQVSAVR